MQRDIAARAAHAPRDSAAFPRPARGPLIVDAAGGTSGLHQPGWRVEVGGNRGDALVRDGTRVEIHRAHDEYRQALENAWRDDPPSGDGEYGQQRGQPGDDPYAVYDAWIEQQWRTL